MLIICNIKHLFSGINVFNILLNLTKARILSSVRGATGMNRYLRQHFRSVTSNALSFQFKFFIDTKYVNIQKKKIISNK